jgi:hypothetical protein
MTFKLSKGGANIAAEVQRWQYFLWRNGMKAVGSIDGDFGPKTEDATKMYQAVQGLSVSGKLDAATLAHAATRGYTIVPSDYYKNRAGVTWPPAPAGLSSPSNSFRNNRFECFEFKKPGSGWEITILNKCSDPTVMWRTANVINVDLPDLAHVSGFKGYMTVHRLAEQPLKNMVSAWKANDLLHLITSFSGAFYARYKKDQGPSTSHGKKSTLDVPELSNHAFGTAFDINVPENGWKVMPAVCGARGSVRELVEVANSNGFYWGGHYSGSKDGMHFELAV